MGEEREEGQGSADAFKAIAALCLFTMAAIGGILPRHLQNVSSRVTSSLNSAAGGVFFASAMVHMLPESSETLNDLWGGVVPWGGMICAWGFLLILCIDQAVAISSANGKGTTNGHTLIPTEESPDEHRDDRRTRGFRNRGHSPGGESQDFSEIEMNGISPRSLLDTGTSSSSLPQGSSPAAAGSRTLHGDVTSEATRINSNSGAIGSSNGDGKHRRRRSDSPRAGMISGADSLSRGMGDDDGHREDHSGNGLLHANAHGTRGHVGHSHGLGVAGDGVWVRLALLLALSVHSVMEGLGLGARSTNAYNLLFAIGVHKGLAAYALGTSLLQNGVNGSELTGYVVAFSMMTPIGILLGAWIEKDGEDDAAGAVCVALAAGTFLYVSLMEVLPPELSSTEHGWMKLGSLLGGFVVSAGVGLMVG